MFFCVSFQHVSASDFILTSLSSVTLIQLVFTVFFFFFFTGIVTLVSKFSHCSVLVSIVCFCQVTAGMKRAEQLEAVTWPTTYFNLKSLEASLFKRKRKKKEKEKKIKNFSFPGSSLSERLCVFYYSFFFLTSILYHVFSLIKYKMHVCPASW